RICCSLVQIDISKVPTFDLVMMRGEVQCFRAEDGRHHWVSCNPSLVISHLAALPPSRPSSPLSFRDASFALLGLGSRGFPTVETAPRLSRDNLVPARLACPGPGATERPIVR